MTLSRRDWLRRSAAMGMALGAVPKSWEWVSAPVDDGGDIPAPAPRVARFEKMAYGMFLHWGLYSQLERGEWAKHFQGLATEPYMRLMKTFDASEFDGRELARFARRCGMKYITLTSRHHDGFSLYDTRGLSKFDVTQTPVGRDLIEDFCQGCRAEGIVPMLYCTTLDWSDPRFETDFPAYLQYLRDSVELLGTQYGEIGGFWFDGNWSRKDADWEVDALYSVIRKHQPQAMIINNTGIEASGRVGHPEVDSVTFERGRPRPLDRSGHPKYVAGEMCHTMNFHWGIASNDFNYLSPAHVIEELCGCRRAGANLLMNVGPTPRGAIPPYERAALSRVGDWIKLHGGEDCVLYGGESRIEGEERDFGLVRGEEVFLLVFDLTKTADTQAHGKNRGAGKRRFRGVEGQFEKAVWIDSGEELAIEQDLDSRELVLNATGYPYGTNTVVRMAKLVR